MSSSLKVSRSLEFSQDLEPFVELKFPVRGQQLPADHGYGLFAAFVHLIPELRQQQDISILTIPGFGDRQGKILLTQQSCCRIRVPISKISLVYQLAGKLFWVGKHQIHLGIPQITPLESTHQLRARIVTIKGYEEADPFLRAAKRQLDALGIGGEITIPQNRKGQLSRKTIKIKHYTGVGFSLEITGLTDEHSLTLQRYGCGGKRHMGCGIFLPYSHD